jgi:uncharacterized membrane protein YjgN (DUF898 family)
MTIEVQCECGKLLRAKDEHAGRKVKCPECGGPIVIPQPSGQVATSPAKRSKRAASGGSIGTPCSFKFTGTGGELFSELIVGYLLTVVTLGIYLPSFLCKMQRWSTGNTTLVDRDGNTVKLEFHGTGGDLFGTLILGGLLTVITFGIYSFWFWVNLTKFFMDNTTGELPDGTEVKMSFQGSGGELFGKCIVAALLCVVTFGIYSPWFVCEIYRYFYGNTRIAAGGSKPIKLAFQGTGGDLFNMFIGGYLLSGITCGIYSFWFQVNIIKFILGNTEVTTPSGNKLKVDFTGTGGEFAVINIVGILLSMVTFGIYYFWFLTNLVKFQTENVKINSA